MGVKAFTNEFGYHDKFILVSGSKQRTRISNGAKDPVSSYSVTKIDNHCERFYKSNNPVIHDENGRPFRRSSKYYRKILQHSWLPANCKVTPTGSRYSYTYTGGISNNTDIERAMSGPFLQDEGFWDNDAHNQSIVECLNKLNDGKVSISNFLGEAVRSADTLAQGLHTLGLAVIAVKRRQFRWLARRGFREPTSAIADGYLSYKYGWKPLMEDLYYMRQGLNDSLVSNMYLSASRRVSTKYSHTSDIDYGGSRFKGSNQCKLINRCKIVARVSDDLLAQAQGIDIINPASLAWELVPYSFVIDWGIPVGNVLAALTAHQGLTFVDGHVSETRHGRVNRSLEGISETLVGTPERVQVDLFAHYREPLGSFPRPIPYAKNPFSTSHVTSALALWRQIMGRR